MDRRSSGYVGVLAVAASLILAAGWLLRPRDIPQSPPPVPSETELQELARRTHRRSLDDTAAYFAQLATDVRFSVVYISSIGTSGMVWDDSHVVTGPIPVSNGPSGLTVRTASSVRAAEATSSPRLPVSILEVNLGTSARTPRRAASLPHTGDWVIAVWQTVDAPAFAAANVRELASATCDTARANELTASIQLTRAMTGGGIFNLDGELLAVILPCGDRMAAIESSSVDDMLKHLAAVEERLVDGYGVLFSSLSQDERQYFSDASGLLVREVWMGTRGEAAGLQPGDIVVALNDHPVASIEDLRPLTAQSGTVVEIAVRRGLTTQRLNLDPSGAAPRLSSKNDPDVGLLIESPATPFRIGSVLPDSRAARAGIKVGDLLRRINHVEPRTRAQADRALKSATSAILLEVERDHRRLAIVIAEGPAQ